MLSCLDYRLRDLEGQISQGKEQSDSGLKVVGSLPWGTHFCQFYQTQKDLSDILVCYFKAGLENNEFCVWVTSEFLTDQEAIAAMKKAVPEFSKPGPDSSFKLVNLFNGRK